MRKHKSKRESLKAQKIVKLAFDGYRFRAEKMLYADHLRHFVCKMFNKYQSDL